MKYGSTINPVAAGRTAGGLRGQQIVRVRALRGQPAPLRRAELVAEPAQQRPAGRCRAAPVTYVPGSAMFSNESRPGAETRFRCATLAQIALEPSVSTLSPGSIMPIDSQAAAPSIVPFTTGVPSISPTVLPPRG